MADDNPQPKPVTRQQQMFQAVLDVTGWRVPAMAPGRVGKLASDLLKSGVTPEDLALRFGTADPGEGWWYWRDDWRGKDRHQRPNEAALRECAGKWEQAVPVTLPTKYASIENWAETGSNHD